MAVKQVAVKTEKSSEKKVECNYVLAGSHQTFLVFIGLLQVTLSKKNGEKVAYTSKPELFQFFSSAPVNYQSGRKMMDAMLAAVSNGRAMPGFRAEVSLQLLFL